MPTHKRGENNIKHISLQACVLAFFLSFDIKQATMYGRIWLCDHEW